MDIVVAFVIGVVAAFILGFFTQVLLTQCNISGYIVFRVTEEDRTQMILDMIDEIEKIEGLDYATFRIRNEINKERGR